MILSKAGKLSLLAGLLCLLLMVFSGASYGAIRWDVLPSPTEVINVGRSEVLGSISLYVQLGQGGTVTTGNSLTGLTQIGVLYFYNGTYVQIDNTTSTGIRVYAPRFASAGVPIDATRVTVQNIQISPTVIAGFITLNIPNNVTLYENDPLSTIRIEGVRGRIDLSSAAAVGSDLYAKLQSINDPAANQFFPEAIRISTSFPPMNVNVVPDVATLCLPPYGNPKFSGAFLGRDGNGNNLSVYQKITVTEGFIRAFVAADSNAPGPDATDRVDSGGPNWPVSGGPAILGAPTNGTELQIVLNGIPASVTGVVWPDTVLVNGSTFPNGYSYFKKLTTTTPIVSPFFAAGTVGGPANGYAWCLYEYFTTNQAGFSDSAVSGLETFEFRPNLQLSLTDQQDVGIVKGAATLMPQAETITGLVQPYSPGKAQPRFVLSYVSGSNTSTDYNSNTFMPYETFAPCTCYLLFPYVTSGAQPGVGNGFDTGIAVANTSDDSGVFVAGTGAPRQAGPITFWFYDYRLGNITPTAGVYAADTTHGLPLGIDASQPAFGGTGQPIYYAGQTLRSLLSYDFFTTGSPLLTKLQTKGFNDFYGYIIAKTNFQFCHGFAYIADKNFATIAQGYLATVIPDPNIKGGQRGATAAADVLTRLAAGESLNN